MTIEEMWDKLLQMGVSEQTLSIISSINGYSKGTMEDVLYAEFGLNAFDQTVPDCGAPGPDCEEHDGECD